MSASKQFKVGIFVIVSVSLGLGSVIALGSGTLFKQTAVVETSTTDSVNGLQIGSPVKYRGVPIGEVTAISFADRWYPRPDGESAQFDFKSPVVIRMKVRLEVFGPNRTQLFGRSVEAGVAQGLRARLTTAGLTGGLYVDIDLNDPKEFPATAPPYAPTYAYIPSAPSRLDQLLKDINSIAADLSRSNFTGLSKSVQQAVDHVDGLVLYRVDPMLDNADQFVTEMRASNARIQEILSDKAIAQTMANVESVTQELCTAFNGTGGDLQSAIKDIPRILASAQHASNELNKILDGEEVARILKSLDDASGKLSPTVDEYRAIGEQVSRLVQSETNELRQLIEALRRTAQHLEEVSARAKNDPAQLIFGKPPAPLPPGAPGPKAK